MLRLRIHLPLLAALVLTGCQPSATPAAGPGSTNAAVFPGLPTQAQPKLTTAKLWLGAAEMEAELALTPEQQRTGMMFRTNMGANAGMLFPLPVTQRASFWMMNCPLPLSAAYISPDGVILELHDFEPYNTNSVVASTDNIRFVLETPRGWFDAHHIGTGTVVRAEQGSLLETFFK